MMLIDHADALGLTGEVNLGRLGSRPKRSARL